MADQTASRRVSAGTAPPSSLRSRAIRASWITIAGFAATQVLRIGSNMTLTRLLFPEAFGLMALVNVLMMGLEMVSDLGVEPSIVQNPREDRTFLDTAWSIQVLRGAVLWVFGIILAAPYAAFYDEPQLLQLVPVVAAGALLTGLKSTHLSALRRSMHVAPILIVELCAQILGIAAMIGIAWVTHSIWSLVVGGLVQSFATTLLSHFAIPGRNRFAWDRPAADAILHMGKWIFLSTLVTFLSQRLDVLALGHLVPLEVLGVFSVANVLAQVPQRVIGQLIMFVHFPAMAESARIGREALAENLQRARGLLLPAMLFVVLGISLLAPTFFRLLYDERYHDAGWMAQLLMLSLWFTTLLHLATRTMLALGDARPLASSNVVRLVFTAIGLVAGYALAEVPGLILGTAAGALAGYLSLTAAVTRHGISGTAEDLRYTAVGVALALLGELAPVWLEGRIGISNRNLLEILCAIPVLLPVGLFAAARAHRMLRSGL